MWLLLCVLVCVLGTGNTILSILSYSFTFRYFSSHDLCQAVLRCMGERFFLSSFSCLIQQKKYAYLLIYFRVTHTIALVSTMKYTNCLSFYIHLERWAIDVYVTRRSELNIDLLLEFTLNSCSCEDEPKNCTIMFQRFMNHARHEHRINHRRIANKFDYIKMISCFFFSISSKSCRFDFSLWKILDS